MVGWKKEAVCMRYDRVLGGEGFPQFHNISLRYVMAYIIVNTTE